MEFFLDNTCQVIFPGAVIHGVFCVRQCIDPSYKPIIKASGYTLIWKPENNKEIDEYSMFFEDKVELNSETDNIDLSLDNDLKSYSKIFNFHLALPNNLPPSHEVPFGHTRYKLEAYYNGQTIFKYFSVNQWVGLKERNNSIVKHEQLIVSLSLCRPIEVELTLNQTNYLPGETVYVGILTNNNSWKDIIFSKIFIIQTTKYWKTHHILPIKHVRVIAEGTRGHLPSGCSQIWEEEPLYIPAVIPTTNTSNNPFNFFEVKYKIKMQIKIKNSKKRIILKQSIFIGNWDTSTNANSQINSVDTPINDQQYEITAKECYLIKQENISFIPKYIIYESS